VGIITPDLGHSTEPPHNYTAGSGPDVDFNPTGQCMTNNGNGNAGFMQIEGLLGVTRDPCMAITPPEGTLYMNYFPDSGFTPQDLINDVECVTGQDNGCGFEQQLESILASDRNTANGGFNRDGALLAVILITDEDDCSTTDPRVFDVEQHDSNLYQGPWVDPMTKAEVQFNLRCSAHSEALQQIQRYVDGIAGLKDDPSQVVFAAITGIPEDTPEDRAKFNSDEERCAELLDETLTPSMKEVPNPAEAGTQGQQLTPACTATDGSGDAFPARRIVETMEGLAGGNTGVGTVVESICAADYAPALNAIVDRIAAALRQLCLPRPLNRNSIDMVGCEVREVQPAGMSCADPEVSERGREAERVSTENVGTEDEPDIRDVCRVTQLPSDPAAGVPSGLGWFYDDFTDETRAACTFNPEQQRVSFTEDAAPIAGARIRFECLQAAPPTTEDIGWPCTGDVCDAASDNTGTVCTTDGDCPNGACERVSDSMCDPNPDNCLAGESLAACETRILKERYDRDNLELVCDTESNTCQLTCQSNVQCPGGFACYDASGDGNSYCVNPTCSLN
jgi:hypothetical protein